MAEILRSSIGFGDFFTVNVYGDDVSGLLTRAEATNTGPASRVKITISIPTKTWTFNYTMNTESRSWNIPPQYRDTQGTISAVFE